MELATLIVAAIAAVFTAMAAIAAWKTTQLAHRDMKRRDEPFVAVGVVRADHDRDGVIVPLKNLGLGPARQIAVLVTARATTLSVRIAPGLAPMESDEWFLPATPWPYVDLPAFDEITIEGNCEDASGTRHPIYFLGSEAIAIQPDEAGTVEVEAQEEEETARSLEYINRHALKKVVRAARTGDEATFVLAWARFYDEADMGESSYADFEPWVRSEWERLSGQAAGFMTPDEVMEWIARVEV